MDKTKIAIELFDQFAEMYQTKFMDVSLYHDTFDWFCDGIKKENAEVLELACGPGNITQYLLQKRPDFKILGTDLAPKMLELAKINNPAAVFEVMDCRAIGAIEKKYDGLMCGFCLPYLSKDEAIQLIADASELLSVDGMLYISTMEDDYAKSSWKIGTTGDKMYQYFHQAEYLEAALKENNFQVLSVIRKKTMGADGVEIVDLVILARRVP